MEDQEDIEERTGYVPIYRKIIDEIFFQDSSYVHAWLYILLNVNHKKRYYKFKEILPGQLICGRKSIAEATGINESKVQRILKYFEEKGYIEQQTNSYGRIITVLSWYKYNNSEQPVNNQRTTSEQPVNTPNNVYNDNNEKKNVILGSADINIFTKPKLEDVVRYVRDKEYGIDAVKFWEHYEEVGWKKVNGQQIVNWKLTVKQWSNREKEKEAERIRLRGDVE